MTDSRPAHPAAPAAKPHHVAFGWPMSLFFVTLLLVFVYLPIDVHVPEALFAGMFSVRAAGGCLCRAHPAALAHGISLALALTSITLSWGNCTAQPAPPLWLSLAAFGISALFIIYTTSVILVLLPPRAERDRTHDCGGAVALPAAGHSGRGAVHPGRSHWPRFAPPPMWAACRTAPTRRTCFRRCSISAFPP